MHNNMYINKCIHSTSIVLDMHGNIIINGAMFKARSHPLET